MSKIKISLNGEDFFIEKDSNLDFLVLNLGLDLQKIAIEKNLEVIFQEDYSKTKINEGDRIEIVSFIGGG